MSPSTPSSVSHLSIATEWPQVGILQGRSPSLIASSILSAVVTGTAGNPNGISMPLPKCVKLSRSHRNTGIFWAFQRLMISKPVSCFSCHIKKIQLNDLDFEACITLQSPGQDEHKRKAQRQTFTWESLSMSKVPEFANEFEPGKLFYKGRSIVTQNGDVAKLASAVIFHDSEVMLRNLASQI